MEHKLKTYLSKHEIEYQEFEHKAVFTVEESKKLKQDIPGLHCKTLFLKDSNGVYYLVGMPADKRLDNKKFIKHFDIRKIRFGTAEELKDKVNLIPGSVSIFGAIYIINDSVKLIIDKEVWDADIVGFHPNVNTSTIVVTHYNLEKFYNSLKCGKEIVEL